MSRREIHIIVAGQPFGRLTAIKPIRKNESGNIIWQCRCNCKNITEVLKYDLIYGKTKSCGCLRKEITSKRKTKHGKCGTREYSSWQAMLNRCYNPNVIGYERYGGRGVKVCHRWHKFENFYADMGERPKGKTLHRRKDSLIYGPQFCEWASYRKQSNNMRSNVIITIKGRTRTLAQWCRKFKLNYNAVKHYIHKHKIPAKIAINYYRKKNLI